MQITKTLRIGDVIGDTIAFIRAEWRSLLPLLVPVLLGVLGHTLVVTRLGLADRPELVFQSGSQGIFWVSMFMMGAAAHWSLVSMLSYSLDRMAGRPTSVEAALLRGLRMFLPVMVIRILVSFAWGFGAVFFLIPGIILYIMFCTSDAAYVEDRAGIFAAMKRSRQLTKGSRWQVFWLLLVIFIALMALSLLGFVGEGAGLVTTLVLGAMSNGILYLATAVLSAVLFRHLRAMAEGGHPDEIAAVF